MVASTLFEKKVERVIVIVLDHDLALDPEARRRLGEGRHGDGVVEGIALPAEDVCRGDGEPRRGDAHVVTLTGAQK
jgi:hypothetical protein